MGPRTGRGATGRSGGRGRGEASALVACGGVGRRLGPLARAPLHPRRPRAVASPTAAWGGHPRGGAPTAPAHARTSTSAGMADECPCGDACSAAGFPPPPPPHVARRARRGCCWVPCPHGCRPASAPRRQVGQRPRLRPACPPSAPHHSFSTSGRVALSVGSFHQSGGPPIRPSIHPSNVRTSRRGAPWRETTRNRSPRGTHIHPNRFTRACRGGRRAATAGAVALAGQAVGCQRGNTGTANDNASRPRGQTGEQQPPPSSPPSPTAPTTPKSPTASSSRPHDQPPPPRQRGGRPDSPRDRRRGSLPQHG